MRRRSLFVLMLLLVSIIISIPVYAQWVLKQSGVNEPLFDVHFADPYTGWAVGGPGIGFPSFPNAVVIKSVDGGETWFEQDTPANDQLFGVCFVNTLIGWAVGANGTIIHTVDGGASWEMQEPPEDYRTSLTDIFCVDNSTAYISGSIGGPPFDTQGTVLKTMNGGDTWTPLEFGWVDILERAFFFNRTTGFVSGLEGVYKTTTGGASWEITSTEGAFAIFMLDEVLGWADGGPWYIQKTDTRGDSWFEYDTDTPLGARGIYFINATHGWFVGNNLIRYTTDGGETWEMQTADIDEYGLGVLPVILRDIQFVGEVGWTVGDNVPFGPDPLNGTILKYGITPERPPETPECPAIVYDCDSGFDIAADYDEAGCVTNYTCVPTEEPSCVTSTSLACEPPSVLVNVWEDGCIVESYCTNGTVCPAYPLPVACTPPSFPVPVWGGACVVAYVCSNGTGVCPTPPPVPTCEPPAALSITWEGSCAVDYECTISPEAACNEAYDTCLDTAADDMYECYSSATTTECWPPYANQTEECRETYDACMDAIPGNGLTLRSIYNVTFVAYYDNQTEGEEEVLPPAPEEGEEEAPGMVPPDYMAYPIKKFFEKVDLLFTFNEQAKAKKKLKYAEKRFVEAVYMAKRGKVGETEKLLQEHQEDLNKAKEYGKADSEIAEKVAIATATHLIVLERMKEKVPEQAKPALEKAILASKKGYEQSLVAISRISPKKVKELKKEFSKEIKKKKRHVQVVQPHPPARQPGKEKEGKPVIPSPPEKGWPEKRLTKPFQPAVCAKAGMTAVLYNNTCCPGLELQKGLCVVPKPALIVANLSRLPVLRVPLIAPNTMVNKANATTKTISKY